MNNIIRYKKYSDFLKEKYGQKVYKLPVNIEGTCPNRDGSKGVGGCTFCSEVGAGFESHSHKVSIEEQILANREKISKGYGAKKFIIYFQNFTGTYMPFEKLKDYIEQAVKACKGDGVEVSISTRPDCLDEEYAVKLLELCKELEVELTFEIGLQSVKEDTLLRINRGHGVEEFINCAEFLNRLGIRYCVHMIIGFPWESREDVRESAVMLRDIGAPEVKIHSLYILKGTTMGEDYLRGSLVPISLEEYIDRVVEFIRFSGKDTVFQRFLGRAPKEESLFCNWSTSWYKIMDMIDLRLEELNAFQGDMSTLNVKDKDKTKIK